MKVAIIRAFIALRHYALTFDQIAVKVLKHEKEIVDMNEVLRQLAPSENDLNAEDRERIGFKK